MNYHTKEEELQAYALRVCNDFMQIVTEARKAGLYIRVTFQYEGEDGELEHQETYLDVEDADRIVIAVTEEDPTPEWCPDCLNDE